MHDNALLEKNNFNFFFQCKEDNFYYRPQQYPVCYESKNDKWILVEANSDPVVQRIDSNEQLANLIFNSFEFKKGNTTTFNATFIAPRDDEQKIKYCVDQYKNTEVFLKNYEITPPKLEKTKCFGSSWIIVATKNGDLEKVKKLVANGADLNSIWEGLGLIDLAKWYITHIAARRKYFDSAVGD